MASFYSENLLQSERSKKNQKNNQSFLHNPSTFKLPYLQTHLGNSPAPTKKNVHKNIKQGLTHRDFQFLCGEVILNFVLDPSTTLFLNLLDLQFK